MAVHGETEGLNVKGLTATEQSKPKGRPLLDILVQCARYMHETFTRKCPYHLLTGRDFVKL